MNKECIGFTLKTTDINVSAVHADYFNTVIDNSIGVIKNNRTDFLWRNINIRNMLGDMYDKYERFNICLNAVAMSSQGTTSTVDIDSRALYIKLNGLPWISSYNNNQTTNDIILNAINIPANTSQAYTQFFTNNVYHTFTKNTDIVNLNIKLDYIENNSSYSPLYTASTELLGHMAFIFTIYGVEPYDIDITRNRIIK